MSKYLTRQTPHIEIRDGYYYHEETSGEDWKLDVGDECNDLLELAEELEVTSQSEYKEGVTNGQFAQTIRSIVRRVAEFEELDTE